MAQPQQQATIAQLPPEEAKEPESIRDKNDNAVANLSAPWEYDDLQPYCAQCSEEFSPLNRRHHCRSCGKIFCGRCSDQRCLIPPSSIVLSPKGGKKAKPRTHDYDISFSPDQDPDRMLTFIDGNRTNNNNDTNTGEVDQVLLYGKGLEERFALAREPLRVCRPCWEQLAPLQEDLRQSNSNAMRYNHIDPTDPKRLFNSPLAFTLGHEIRKAAYTLNNLLPLPKRMGHFVPVHHGSTGDSQYMSVYQQQQQQCSEQCSAVSPNLGDLDGVRIPAKLLEEAKGIATLTIVKGGFGLFGAEFGSGLVVARLSNGRWSAPSAIGAAGLSWGALIGAQVSDHVFLLMTDSAVEMLFSNNGSINLGADVGVAVGPLGRTLEGNVGASTGSVAPIYTYSQSKGLYAGVSVDGKLIVTRHDVNEKFYGRQVSGAELLSGLIPTPPAAQPLYDALTRCHVYATTTGTHGSSSARRAMRNYDRDDNTNLEYGEYMRSALSPEPHAMMPPAPNDQHSYVSDLTDLGSWS